jgi:Predicted ATPase (AAA+ superfamily)
LAIDEAQNIPQIGSILKLIVDEIPGISVLASGSSSFDLLNKAGEPLVGRSMQFLLTPFSQQEMPTTPKVFKEAYPHAKFQVVNKENYLQFI